jgi:predicted methyltransferase
MKIEILAMTAFLAVIPSCATAVQNGDEGERASAGRASGDFHGLTDVLRHERRAEDKVRDRDRHPEETLRFFNVQPNHTVVEYAPGSGWYTRILAPYVAEDGHFIAVSFAGEDTPVERLKTSLAGWDQKMPGRVEEMTGVSADAISAYYGSSISDDTAGTADRILIARMLHNLLRWEIADQELLALRKMLKDDGLVGVVQHRAPSTAPYSYTDGNKGYLHEDDVIALMELYGFVFLDKSEINANPNDPANHAAGVWTLPPSYTLGDQDKGKYTAIGESDRATLLFKKAK